MEKTTGMTIQERVKKLVEIRKKHITTPSCPLCTVRLSAEIEAELLQVQQDAIRAAAKVQRENCCASNDCTIYNKILALLPTQQQELPQDEGRER